MSMVGEVIWVQLKGRRVRMQVTESEMVYEQGPEGHKGFNLVLRRPNGAIFYEGFLPMGKTQIEENVRESASQIHDLNRSLRW